MKMKKSPREILIDYLDCPCRIFEPMKDDSVLIEAYKEALERGKSAGFVPVLVCCEDAERLLETFLWNTSSKESVNENYNFDMEEVRAFREKMCKTKLPEGTALFKEWTEGMGEDKDYEEEGDYEDYEDEDEDYEDENEDYEDYDREDYGDEDYEGDYEDYEDDGEDYDNSEDDDDDDEDYEQNRESYEAWKRECLRQMAEEEDEDMDNDATFVSYRSYDGVNCTSAVLLAEIPVTNPWEVFAWLPFGGWNECPDTEDLMAVSKYWFEIYGAVPATMNYDVLEYMIKEPVKEGNARKLAWEMSAFCPDIITQGAGDVELLAEDLTESEIWYFWWD